MIISNFETLRRQKALAENRDISLRRVSGETGLAQLTILKIKAVNPDRFDAKTLSTLCAYFGCGVGDLLEYVPDEVVVQDQGAGD